MDGSAYDTPAAPAAGEAGFAGGNQLDLRRLLTTFRRHLRLFLAVAILAFLPVMLAAYQATPRYTASSSVMLDTRKENVVDVGAVLSGLSADSAVVDTEVEILRSRTLAERVARRLRLDQSPEFNSRLRPPKLTTQVRRWVGGLTRSAAPGGEAVQGAVARQREWDRVVDAVMARLKVRRSGLTYVINISFESEIPTAAAQIANEFANSYLLEQLNAKFDATRQANGWLNERLTELRGQVQSAEAAVQQYRIANNLMSADGATLTEQEISTLNSQLAVTRAAQAEQEARLNIARNQLAAGSTGGDIGEALTSPVIQQLRSQRSQQAARVADMAGRYGDRHPDLVKARGALQEIDQQIQQEIQRIISNLEAQAQVARQRTASIESSAARSRGTLAGNNRAQVRLAELERNAEAVRTLYESFLGRFKQTSAQEGIEQSDARVVSLAKIPTSPSFPDKQLGLLLALAAGLGAGLAAVVLTEILSSGFVTAEDIEQRLGLSCLGSVPTLSSTLEKEAKGSRLDPVDYVARHPLSSFAEALRGLRASVVLSRMGQRAQVIAVTSSLPGEGKTTTAVCLGRTLAIAGSSVVIVDCDLRQRAVNRILPNDPTVGLIEVLNGANSLDSALVRDDATSMSILPLAKSAFTPRDIFGSRQMRTLMDELRGRFDVVILDTAPVLPVADTRMLAPLADAVVLLVRWRKTPQKAVESTLRLLSQGGPNIVGVALTQVDMNAQSRYGYGDPGYYAQSYRKYYGV